ncbi:MAG: YidC/Oxa1 family insertase periplasmic-domain containing protein [Planctomycetes bacterium]|nr:YidC/Oxa1 family insertase periplasmic-domain containing protein [Planctomycetota bacterium]
MYPRLTASNAKLQTKTLGAVYDQIKRTDDPDKHKFQVEFTSKGAALKTVTLSEFADRDAEQPTQLVLLSPLMDGAEIYSFANTKLYVAPAGAKFDEDLWYPLSILNWILVETDLPDEVRFETVLFEDNTKAEMLKVIKTYRLQPGSYELTCDITVENLSGKAFNVQMQVQGPGGMSREDARQDTRKVMTAYSKDKDIETHALPSTSIRSLEREKIKPATGFFASLKKMFGKGEDPDKKLKEALKENTDSIIWAASTNKYFAAIVRPENVGVSLTRAAFYDTDLLENKPAKQAGASFLMETASIELAPAGVPGNQQSLNFSVYLGPKDKRIFENNETYKTLQYYQTIDFRGCCCPVKLISTLAFGVMWLMNTMFTLMGPLGNYGVVIIILVFLVRLAMHPITKKSQVSMMKMQKLGPKMKEIQAKYANNKQEMNKQVMAMYRDEGVSPVSGMLPMMLQMPIWIALWTAVNTNIDIRGAGFLPFWITDLASPDHLFRFPFGLNLPFFGEYFNLLPLLMGGVMYLQQKMMPSAQATAQPDSQMAQQQKMMMIMMPLLFPVMLYAGPSGVNLYILSSITAGVIEQKVIRKHLKEKDELEAAGKVPVTAKTGGKVKKKKPKPMYKG